MRAERVGGGVRRRPFDVQVELYEQRQLQQLKSLDGRSVITSGQHKQKKKSGSGSSRREEMPQANDQKHVTPNQRPREFPNQKLIVSGGKQDLSLHDYVECSLILQ